LETGKITQSARSPTGVLQTGEGSEKRKKKLQYLVFSHQDATSESVHHGRRGTPVVRDMGVPGNKQGGGVQGEKRDTPGEPGGNPVQKKNNATCRNTFSRWVGRVESSGRGE